MQLNIIDLAKRQILKERRVLKEDLILSYAVRIRKWLDKHSQKTAIKIMQGDNIYCYGNKIKTYAKMA
jgi:hypothetical protein